MILKFIFIAFLLNGITDSFKSFKPDNFCMLSKNIREEVVCKKYQCSFNICSANRKSCNHIINHLSKLKTCHKNEYVSLKTQVCLKNLKKQKILNQLLKTTITKHKSFYCTGKLKFDCENNYCSVNKNTCNIIFKTKKNKSFFNQINYC